MNNLLIKFLLLLLTLSFPCSGEAQINYGSNNGKNLIIRGTKVYYEEYGRGIPLLLLHGGFGNMADFNKCIPELSTKYRVITPDAPGLGRSDFPDGPLSYRLIADYYSSMIDQLKLDSVYIIGWSDGGIVGLILANSRPDKVKKLLASGSNYKMKGMQGIEEATATMLNIDWIQANMNDWVENYKRLSPQDDWKRYVVESKKMYLADQYFPKQLLEEIKIPVLICYGDHDMISLEHGIEIKNAIPNSQLCILPNTSHSAFAEKPSLINKIAIDFFNGK